MQSSYDRKNFEQTHVVWGKGRAACDHIKPTLLFCYIVRPVVDGKPLSDDDMARRAEKWIMNQPPLHVTSVTNEKAMGEATEETLHTVQR